MWIMNINHLGVLYLSLWRQSAASADCRLFAQGGFLFPYKSKKKKKKSAVTPKSDWGEGET